MNAGLICASRPRRDAQNERDGASLRSSVAAATPSQQHYNLALNLSSSSRPSSRCCWQHLEEQGRGGTSTARGGTRATRRISSVAAASAPSQQQKQATAVSRDHEWSTGLLRGNAMFRHGHKQTVYYLFRITINLARKSLGHSPGGGGQK